ncbi:MAG: hypothetical protein ABIW76_22550 [Fibrobacteria bacterium]
MFDLRSHARTPGNLAFFLMTNLKNRRKRSLEAEADSLPSRLLAKGVARQLT